jgi:hypothetical protein
MTARIYFSVDRTPDGRFQLSINDEGSGGYRICGPKYVGSSTNVARHQITDRDVDEIRQYLKLARKRCPQENEQ